VSEHTLDTHIRGGCFKENRTTVIYNISNFARAIEPRQSQGRHDDNGSLVFGFIGKIEQAKGIETLLSATTRLRSGNWKLHIAGTGFDTYVRDLSRKFSDPRIAWLGFTDADKFYSSVDVVVIPSVWADPLPLVCVESLRAGRALICARSGGIPEIARLSDIVEFYPAGDVTVLAEKMDLALMSPQRWRQFAIGNPSVLDVFREDNVVQQYLQEYGPSAGNCRPSLGSLRDRPLPPAAQR
jgi:glycosyltransferase involved in cell wall biosynthesis